MNLILELIDFLFKNSNDLFNYFDSFETGTHIYLFDLRTKSKNEMGYLKTMKENNSLDKKILTNYELIFDEEENDILLNNSIDFPENFKNNIIDFSFKKFIKFLFLKPDTKKNIYLFGKKLDIENPYYSIKAMTDTGKNVTKIINLNYNNDNSDNNNEEKIIDCFNIEGSEYKGILFNVKFIDNIINDNNIGIEDIKEKDYLNGVLIYKENILITRLNQQYFGDFNFFVKKMMILNDKKENELYNDNNFEENLFNSYNLKNIFFRKIFKKNGYLELPSNSYDLLFNGCEIKDQALFGFFYNKMKSLLQKIEKQ